MSGRAKQDGDATRGQVREHYRKIATEGDCGCGRGSSTSEAPCCSPAEGDCGCGRGPSTPGSPCCGATTGQGTSRQLGYSDRELKVLPAGADLGLGCGNPIAIASLRAGQTVLDLGSGAGIDCFLASKKVGARGRVIGVDMTPEMLAKARENARKGGYRNVDFRLGEIEHLPVADETVDVVISNCVINLAPDKGIVYREAFRVLRPGGRFAVSDVVATRPITDTERADPSLWSSCSSGALEVPQIEAALRAAGFEKIEVALRVPAATPSSLEGQRTLGVVPADLRAVKPRE